MNIINLTKEQRRALAKAMFSPIRCGGSDYDADGTRKYLVGGKRITEAEFKAIVAKINR